MPKDIPVQISENIQKLFDLSTRIDEHMKSIQIQQDQLDKRIDNTVKNHIEVVQKIAVLESHDYNSCHNQMVEIDKRLILLEEESGTHNERWKGVAAFVIQLVWVILAAYLLTKLNLQSPAVP
jgi:predicted transcriptional regulator